MKKFIILLYFILLCPIVTHGQYIKSKIDTSNSALLINAAAHIDQLKDSSLVIVARPYIQIFDKNMNLKSSLGSLVYGNLHTAFQDNFGSIYGIYEDFHDNLVFYSLPSGLAIIPEDTSKAQFFSQYQNKNFCFVVPPVFSEIDDCLYIANSYAWGKYRRFFKIPYDKEEEKYVYNPEDSLFNEISIPDSLAEKKLWFSGSALWKEGKEIVFLADGGIVTYNIENNSWNNIDSTKNETDFQIYQTLRISWLKPHYPQRRRYPVYFTYDKNHDEFLAYLLTEFYPKDYAKDDSQYYEYYSLRFKLEAGKLVKTQMDTIPLKFGSGIFRTDCDVINDSIVAFSNGSRICFNNINTGEMKVVPYPKELEYKKNDGRQYPWELWYLSSIKAFPEKNELWVGASYEGIYVCDLQIMLDVAEPYSAVEDDIEYSPFFPMIMRDKVYPLPSVNGFTNISFFQQLGTTEDLEISVFDIQGTKMEQAEITVEVINGIHKQAKIATSNLSAGIYLCQIKYKEHSTTVKFVVN